MINKQLLEEVIKIFESTYSDIGERIITLDSSLVLVTSALIGMALDNEEKCTSLSLLNKYTVYRYNQIVSENVHYDKVINRRAKYINSILYFDNIHYTKNIFEVAKLTKNQTEFSLMLLMNPDLVTYPSHVFRFNKFIIKKYESIKEEIINSNVKYN